MEVAVAAARKGGQCLGFPLAGESRVEAWDRAVAAGSKANKSHLSE